MCAVPNMTVFCSLLLLLLLLLVVVVVVVVLVGVAVVVSVAVEGCVLNMQGFVLRLFAGA
jgi:hypothetical protein